MGTFKYDLLQLLLFGLPLCFVWWSGRFSFRLQPLESAPDTAEFKPYIVLFVLVTLHISVVWLEALLQ